MPPSICEDLAIAAPELTNVQAPRFNKLRTSRSPSLVVAEPPVSKEPAPTEATPVATAEPQPVAQAPPRRVETPRVVTPRTAAASSNPLRRQSPASEGSTLVR